MKLQAIINQLDADTILIADGLYFLHPEGSGWIGVEFQSGRLIQRVDQANAATHAAARDRHAGVVPSDSDQAVDLATAAEIVREVLGEDSDAEMVVVEKADG